MTPSTPNPRYALIRSETTHHLVDAVDRTLQDGVWECVGAPFFDKDRNSWCQAIVRPYREPAKGKK